MQISHAEHKPVLIVDSQAFFAQQIERRLDRVGLLHVTPVHVTTLEQARRWITDRGSPELLLVDLTLSDSCGIETLRVLRECAKDTPIILLVRTQDEELARRAVRGWAQDYLIKERLDDGQLVRAVRYAADRKRAERRLSYLDHHDAVTGLANARSTTRRLGKALLQARRDGSQGGLLLVSVARPDNRGLTDDEQRRAGQVILAATRQGDLVARLDGSTFAILACRIAGRNDARIVAERILQSVRERSEGWRLSSGIALFPNVGSSVDAVLSAARGAVVRASAAGDGELCWAPDRREFQAPPSE